MRVALAGLVLPNIQNLSLAALRQAVRRAVHSAELFPFAGCVHIRVQQDPAGDNPVRPERLRGRRHPGRRRRGQRGDTAVHSRHAGQVLLPARGRHDADPTSRVCMREGSDVELEFGLRANMRAGHLLIRKILENPGSARQIREPPRQRVAEFGRCWLTLKKGLVRPQHIRALRRRP